MEYICYTRGDITEKHTFDICSIFLIDIRFFTEIDRLSVSTEISLLRFRALFKLLALYFKLHDLCHFPLLVTRIESNILVFASNDFVNGDIILSNANT